MRPAFPGVSCLLGNKYCVRRERIREAGIGPNRKGAGTGRKQRYIRFSLAYNVVCRKSSLQDPVFYGVPELVDYASSTTQTTVNKIIYLSRDESGRQDFTLMRSHVAAMASELQRQEDHFAASAPPEKKVLRDAWSVVTLDVAKKVLSDLSQSVPTTTSIIVPSFIVHEH